MAEIICNEECITELDSEQIKVNLESIDILLRKSIETDLSRGRIDATLATDMWTRLMGTAISSIIGAVASVQSKETAMDRCLKQEQCDSSLASTTRNDELAVSKITNDLCLATADCSLKDAQKAETTASTTRNDELSSSKITNDLCLATAECNLKGTQETKIAYEVSDVLPKQVLLTERQTDGFDDNLRQKLFESQMNAWAMMFSSGLLESMPCFIASDEASKLYGGILDGEMPEYIPLSEEECCVKSGGTWADGKCNMGA